MLTHTNNGENGVPMDAFAFYFCIFSSEEVFFFTANY